MHRFASFIKTYAKKHYNENGWDYIVETYEDDELNELLNELAPTSEDEAVSKVIDYLAPMVDRRIDIQAERF